VSFLFYDFNEDNNLRIFGFNRCGGEPRIEFNLCSQTERTKDIVSEARVEQEATSWKNPIELEKFSGLAKI